MNDATIIVRKAVPTDIPAIVMLQKANQRAQGGSLSGELSAERIIEMLVDLPQIVACRGNQVVGFLLATSQAISRKHPVPIVEKMLQAFPSVESDAYVYGPVCVSGNERGKGLAQRLFAELLTLEPTRQGVLFIRDDNPASLQAHRKMGMAAVSQFNFEGGLFHVFTYKPSEFDL